ncbi:MAG: phytanoyl-CoA dioxygenase family protein [Candidatus Poribacteria bacterium]|nr:phytanoyl-CoA dioxygenase family protein [Candidatus Poribacteria bacterium]
MSVLSQQDFDFFDEHGYVVIKNAVSKDDCEAVVDAIWDFLGMDRDNPDDWYREPHRRGGGMVELYQHQALWTNRQNETLHAAFSQIHGTHKLWVTMDRANMKPPSNPKYPEYGHPGFMHWDADTSQLPVRFGVQGVLYLRDTAEDQGGFQCIPGIHKLLTREVDPVAPDLKTLEATAIPGKQGDFLIWHRALAHGNGHNRSDKPRLAQYISMRPAREDDEEARLRRVELWQKRLCQGGRAFPGDPRRVEELHGTTAVLSPLGKKLVGVDRWEDESQAEAAG